MKKDLKKFGIMEEDRFMIAQDHSAWRYCCKDGLQMVASKRMNAMPKISHCCFNVILV